MRRSLLGLAAPPLQVWRCRARRAGAEASEAVPTHHQQLEPFSAELKPQRQPTPADGRRHAAERRPGRSTRRRGGGVSGRAEIVERARAVPIVAVVDALQSVRGRQGQAATAFAGAGAFVGLRRAAESVLRARVVRVLKALRAVDLRVAAALPSSCTPKRATGDARRFFQRRSRIPQFVRISRHSRSGRPSS